MSKYYLKPHVTDEMLQAVGFEIWTDFCVRKNECGFSVILKQTREITQEDTVIFDGFENRHILLKDLIDLNYVEVRND